jgi:hypothetical protein
MTQPLVLPSEIPWQDIKGAKLEELLYWLFDSMGAKELEWRIGGRGTGAADQGRDLELVFFTPCPDGTLAKQSWWVEAKGRKGTVEPTAVQAAVLNASGKADVEVLVIATNANFSNQSRDWVKDWQRTHRKPTVKLWERTELENLCSRNPAAIVRLYSKALGPQGRVEVARSRLWEYAMFTDEPALERLWLERAIIAVDDQALLALAASEIANGNLNIRPWASIAEDDVLISTLSGGLLNFFYLILKASERGYRQEPIIGAVSYILLACVDRFGHEQTACMVNSSWHDCEERQYPPELQKFILRPIATQLQAELREACSQDCRRVTTGYSALRADEAADYWSRLGCADHHKTAVKPVVTIENENEPCTAGLDVHRNGCPLCNEETPQESLDAFLHVVQVVTKYRRAPPLRK